MSAQWQPNPVDVGYQCDLLIDDEGRMIATLEVFPNAAYPWACDPSTGAWARGGAFGDFVKAMQWAERYAGLHRREPGDARE